MPRGPTNRIHSNTSAINRIPPTVLFRPTQLLREGVARWALDPSAAIPWPHGHGKGFVGLWPKSPSTETLNMMFSSDAIELSGILSAERNPGFSSN